MLQNEDEKAGYSLRHERVRFAPLLRTVPKTIPITIPKISERLEQLATPKRNNIATKNANGNN